MVAFNMIVLHSGVSAASYTTEAPLAAPPVPRMLQTMRVEKMNAGQVCPLPVAHIESASACKLAAKALGHWYGGSWNGHSSFPGCFYSNDKRKAVYFNLNRKPNYDGKNPIYQGICYQNNYDYELNLNMKKIAYACHNKQCLNDRPLPNKAAAMKACDENPDCGSIVCVTETKYGLRRWTETKTEPCETCLTFEKPQFLRNAQKLARNKLLKTLPNVNGEYRVSFDALVRDVDSSQLWHNMIHLSTGENKVHRGNRIPGLWLFKNGRLHVTSDVNGDLNYITDDTQAFPLNRWVSIVVQSKKTHGVHIYSVTVDGRKIREVENKDAELYQNVKVYAADPWYPAANAYIRNLQTTTTCPKKLPFKSQCKNHCDCQKKCSPTQKMCC